LNNSPEWNFVDMGLLQIGAIQVPVYPTISKEHFRHIFRDAEVRLAIIANKAVFENIRDILEENNIRVFCLEQTEAAESFDDLLEHGRQHPVEDKVKSISDSIDEEDVATLIYTSGTTGLPKGVMLTHKNLVSQFLAVTPISGLNHKHRALSFLPLCHVYERMLNYMYQNLGLSIYYAETIDNIGGSIRETKPHVFCAVPRVLEKTYDKIVAAGRDLKPVPKNIFFWALNLGKQYDPNKKGPLLYRLQLLLADFLVFRKWRKALGNELEIVVSGSASLQDHIARVFWAAGIKVLEGYGLTETSPVIAVSTLEPDGVKIGTVGPVLQGVEVKLAEDGEILARGPNVMKGYFKHPEWTAQMIDQDGWLKTGDIGTIENDRFLKITDRKKEMIKTSGGKYIAPQVVENMLKSSPFIEQTIVVGESRNYAAALIVPDYHHLESWCRVKKIDYQGPQKAIETERIVKRIREEIVKINYELGKTEKIKRFVLLAEPFSIEDQTLSPTLKLRRNQIVRNYTDIINKMYSGRIGTDVIERK
jgi:long-chain acyl-CoA synthetase